MNIMFALLPILIVALLIYFAVYLMKGSGSRRSKYTNAIKGQWLLTGYVLVLLFSVGVFFFFPIETESISESTTPLDDIPDLFIALDKGEVSSIDRKFIEKEWKFAYEGDQLELTLSGTDNVIPIYIDKTNETDSTIHVVHYRTPTIIIGNTDITEYFPPVNIDLKTNKLNVEAPEQVELEFAGYKQEFPFTQFVGNGKRDWIDWENGPYLNRGQQIVYIRVPANIKVNFDSDLWIDYVGK